MSSVQQTASDEARPQRKPPPRGEVVFRLLVEAVADYAIFLLDRDGNVQSWNRGAERIKGYRAEEIIGQHFSRFYTPEDLETNRPMRLLAAAASDGRVEDEGWRVRKDGTRFWADVIVTALVDGNGELYAFAKVTRDLTERRAAEERDRQLLVEQRARTVAEEALQARDRFLGIASHELKTPVASVQLAVDSIVHARDAGKLDDERLDALVRRMVNATRRLAGLVDELLNVSLLNTDTGQLALVPTDVTEVVSEVVARFHDAGQTRLRFEAGPSLVIPADASRLDQVFTNLIDNALKYSEPPGDVLVTIRRTRGEAVVTITDAGIGLEIDDGQSFGAFERGANAEHVPGMGLGLYISSGIVDLHDGRLELAARHDTPGTIATVRLPAPDVNS